MRASLPQQNTTVSRQLRQCQRSVVVCRAAKGQSAPDSSTHQWRAALAAGFAAALVASPAQAGPFGEAIASAWKGRQQANSEKILAPIRAAEAKLQEAIDMFDKAPSPQALTPVLYAVRASSMNCYLFEAALEDTIETRASLMTQQFQFADPCTLRLIVKNVTGLSPEGKREEGMAMVNDIILSYQKLDGELEGAIEGSVEAPKQARAQLTATLTAMKGLEEYVVDVLAV